ncbi:hypothetical protein CKALI_04310 [Corynebacterium kalinowskii]|uniref:Uncharacterized protein n=2 Tax=Corynebacterium kalinowskii TaxID=2675216 RepID=A0A6B8VPJ8_9CORY|nr:hypothetical protein CKALI_04310 [Corynebacterium kalinowskii]
MFYSDAMINNTQTSAFTATVDFLRRVHFTSLATVGMTIKHPRSLARSTAAWRPPTIRVSAQGELSPINFTITRHRVGHLARARIRGYGETRTPAYMIMVRLTAPDGRAIEGHEARTWMRAILPDTGSFSLHGIDGLGAPTYCWVVDQHFTPIESPASLFKTEKSAA